MEINSQHDNFDLVGKYLAKELKPDEQVLFDKWLNESEHNREELNRIHKYTALLEANIVMHEVDVDKARIITDFKIWKNKQRAETENARINQRLQVKKIYRIAAVLLFLIANAAVLIFLFPSKISSGFTEVVAPLGSRTQLKLPDGTAVWLNAGSTLKYANNFSKENRAVHIEGEAFFDVTHDPSHPFVVDASTISLKVLGTAFNIRAYKDENTIETTLVRGKVEIEKISPSAGETKIVLNPNEKATFNKNENKLFVNDLSEPAGQIDSKKLEANTDAANKSVSSNENAVPPAEVVNTIAWKEGYLVFNNDPLSEIIVVLSRRYDVHFNYTDKEILKYRFTGKFKETTLEQVMQAITLTSPLEVAVKKDQVTIKENPLRKKKYIENTNQN